MEPQLITLSSMHFYETSVENEATRVRQECDEDETGGGSQPPSMQMRTEAKQSSQEAQSQVEQSVFSESSMLFSITS